MGGGQRRVLRRAAAPGGRRPSRGHGGRRLRRGWPKGPAPVHRAAPRCRRSGGHGALGTSAAATTSWVAPQSGHRPTRRAEPAAGALPAAAAAAMVTMMTETGGTTLRRMTRGEGEAARRAGRARRGRPTAPCSGRCRYRSGGTERTPCAGPLGWSRPPLAARGSSGGGGHPRGRCNTCCCDRPSPRRCRAAVVLWPGPGRPEGSFRPACFFSASPYRLLLPWFCGGTVAPAARLTACGCAATTVPGLRRGGCHPSLLFFLDQSPGRGRQHHPTPRHGAVHRCVGGTGRPAGRPPA